MKQKIKITIKRIVNGDVPYLLHSIHGAVVVRGVTPTGAFTLCKYEVGDRFTGSIVQSLVDNRDNDVTVTL